MIDTLDKVLGGIFVVGGSSGGIAWSPPIQRWFEEQCIRGKVECFGDVPGWPGICDACADAGNLAVQLPFGTAGLAVVVFSIKFFASLGGI